MEIVWTKNLRTPRDWPTMGGSKSQTVPAPGMDGSIRMGNAPTRCAPYAPYAPFHITFLSSGSIVSCSNYDAWQHAGLDSPCNFWPPVNEHWALSKGKSRASSPETPSWDILRHNFWICHKLDHIFSRIQWIQWIPGSFFQLGISPNSPSADRIRLQPDSKD